MIYINDLQNVSKLFKVICFADDSTLIISLCFSKKSCKLCKNENTFENDHINAELEKIYNWFCINKLSINPSKTKYMLFKSRQRDLSNLPIPTLQLNNRPLERVNKFLYLGIYIDEDLTWDHHVNYISNKMSKNIGILRRLKHTIPKNVLKTIYFSLINPHLNYGTLLWGYNLNRVEKLQKEAVRIITHSHFLAHTSNLFKQLNLLKIDDIFKLKQFIFYYKFVANKLPNPIKNILTKQREGVRSCHTAYFLMPPPRTNTENARQCIRYTIPNLINNYKARMSIIKLFE